MNLLSVSLETSNNFTTTIQTAKLILSRVPLRYTYFTSVICKGLFYTQKNHPALKCDVKIMCVHMTGFSTYYNPENALLLSHSIVVHCTTS